ncbi:MAG: response regulator [Oligoflexales bacterium]|nr:response regulator [Oligoflexales bacterium]
MRKKVLIVDDEPQYLEALSTYIVKLGDFDCTTKSSGRGALQTLSKQKFECILLDLVMPDIGGIQVLKEIQTQKIDTRVVVISGFLNAQISEQCKKYGAYDVIDKPVDMHKLKCILKRVKAF